MDRFVLIDGKKYDTANRAYTPRKNTARQTRVTLGRTTITTIFAHTDTRWNLEILVPLDPSADAGRGHLSHLEQVDTMLYFDFRDQQGNNHKAVIEGELQEALRFTIIDEAHPIRIPLLIRKITDAP